MSNLLFNPALGFWSVLGIWSASTMVFGIALWLAVFFTDTKISLGALILVVIGSSLALFVPYVGLPLSLAVALFLLYRLSDAEFQQACITVLLTRFLAVFLFLGISAFIAKQRNAGRQQQEQAQQQQLQNLLIDQEHKHSATNPFPENSPGT